MAVVANATTITSLDDVILAEYISRRTRTTLGRAPTVYQEAVMRVPLMGLNSNNYAHPLRNQIAAATVLTETDEVVSTEITTQEVVVGTATIAVATFLSDKANRTSIWPAINNAVDELVFSCARKIDNDFLALASGFSSPIGDNATVNTVSNLVTLFTAWTARVESTGSMPLLVMHPDARRDLQNDAVSNAASWFGASMGVQLHDATKGLNTGVVTTFDGVRMVMASGLPAGDTTGWSNVMLNTDDDNPAIAMPFEKPITVEVWREPKRLGVWLIASADYGMGEVDDAAGLTFITQT